nr:MAG TPA: hypothetical protein [Crassvirales sp.]
MYCFTSSESPNFDKSLYFLFLLNRSNPSFIKSS